MLESSRGRQALVTVGTNSWVAFGRRQRKGIILQGDVAKNPRIMNQFVDAFINKCRADPPNVIVSSRLTGEGVTQRLAWADMLGRGEQ